MIGMGFIFRWKTIFVFSKNRTKTSKSGIEVEFMFTKLPKVTRNLNGLKIEIPIFFWKKQIFTQLNFEIWPVVNFEIFLHWKFNVFLVLQMFFILFFLWIWITFYLSSFLSFCVFSKYVFSFRRVLNDVIYNTKFPSWNIRVLKEKGNVGLSILP